MNPEKVEEWRSLEPLGFPKYKVSSYGVVLGARGRPLSSNPSADGYVRVKLYNNGHGKTFRVHRLVAHIFIGDPEEGQTVDHVDRNRSNNHFFNLRWVTSSEQTINRAPSKRRGGCKPVQQLTMDGEIIRTWDSMTEMVDETGYPYSSISWAIKNKRPYRGSLWEFLSNEIEGEIWREFTLPGSETYWASNLGRIRRPVVKGSNAHEITAGTLHNGYMSINILIEGFYKTILVHTLVALAFHGTKPEGHVVNHKDGNKANNRKENLEYVTQRQNAQHAHDIGLSKSRGKRIRQFSLKGEFIAEYTSISEAVRAEQESAHFIRQSLNFQKHSRFIWKYV